MYWDIIEINASAPRTFDILFKDGLRGTIFIDVSFCTGVFEILKDPKTNYQKELSKLIK